jgi:class 3 adenylate cyclase
VQALQAAERSAIDDRLLVHQEGENRFVTVLFADMTSSVQTTHGLRADEAAELVNNLLSAMVDSLKRYDGRIDRFLGDGVLAVFGTPHAHENDPERAFLAAMEIRDAAQERSASRRSLSLAALTRSSTRALTDDGRPSCRLRNWPNTTMPRSGSLRTNADGGWSWPSIPARDAWRILRLSVAIS